MKITGYSKIEVIVPELPTERESFAAGELKEYIEKVFNNSIFKHQKIQGKIFFNFLVLMRKRKENI